ncbi:MAG: hypothetical protein U0L65_05260 [Bacteroidales bacterium]|nr:hypothetical protein [Bacteroidales bacterium]
MKKKIDLLLAIFLVVISFGFISCESDKEEIEANYTYLSDFNYYGGISFTWNTSCLVETYDNNILIKKSDVEFPSAQNINPMFYRIDTEISNDTIYVTEKWFNALVSETPRYINSNIFVANIPKGKWVINNSLLLFPNDYEAYNEESPYVSTIQMFSIEIE